MPLAVRVILFSWLAKTAGAAIVVGAYWVTVGRHQP